MPLLYQIVISSVLFALRLKRTYVRTSFEPNRIQGIGGVTWRMRLLLDPALVAVSHFKRRSASPWAATNRMNSVAVRDGQRSRYFSLGKQLQGKVVAIAGGGKLVLNLTCSFFLRPSSFLSVLDKTSVPTLPFPPFFFKLLGSASAY